MAVAGGGCSLASAGPAIRRSHAALAEFGNLVMEHYVPAAVLINAADECVFTFGAIERYLQVPPGASDPKSCWP